MAGNRLDGTGTGTGVGYSSGNANEKQKCFNFNKLGGRENDPKGCAWAYSYASDQNRNFYAQHEVMGYLEKDTCVKRDFWTACSRMSIEDQLYGLAFASETDQDLCMAVTCARRWSEVEDALAESCTAADLAIGKPPNYTFSLTNIHMKSGGTHYMDVNQTLTLQSRRQGNLIDGEVLKYTAHSAAGSQRTGTQLRDSLINGAAAITAYRAGTTIPARWTVTTSGNYDIATASNATEPDFGIFQLAKGYMLEGTTYTTGTANAGTDYLDSLELSADPIIVGPGLGRLTVGQESTTAAQGLGPLGTATYVTTVVRARPFVDLFINVRVSNGHPKALDTILRVRFTVSYTRHEPSALNTWNTRASKAAEGVIKTGVVGDAPEGGKLQQEDTTVVVA